MEAKKVHSNTLYFYDLFAAVLTLDDHGVV